MVGGGLIILSLLLAAATAIGDLSCLTGNNTRVPPLAQLYTGLAFGSTNTRVTCGLLFPWQQNSAFAAPTTDLPTSLLVGTALSESSVSFDAALSLWIQVATNNYSLLGVLTRTACPKRYTDGLADYYTCSYAPLFAYFNVTTYFANKTLAAGIFLPLSTTNTSTLVVAESTNATSDWPVYQTTCLTGNGTRFVQSSGQLRGLYVLPFSSNTTCPSPNNLTVGIDPVGDVVILDPPLAVPEEEEEVAARKCRELTRNEWIILICTVSVAGSAAIIGATALVVKNRRCCAQAYRKGLYAFDKGTDLELTYEDPTKGATELNPILPTGDVIVLSTEDYKHPAVQGDTDDVHDVTL